MKIMIAVPCMDTVPVGFVESLINMAKPEGTAINFHPNSLVYDSRNLLSLCAMENDFDYILWLDSDVMCPPDTIQRLLDDMNDHDADIVSGLYVSRKHPPSPVIYNNLDVPGRDETGRIISKLFTYDDYPINQFFQVAACGFGCVMTRTSLFRKVWDKFGPPFAPYPWSGEDVAFCYRLKQLNIPIYCDSSISCGHIGQCIFNETWLPKRGDDNEKH